MNFLLLFLISISSPTNLSPSLSGPAEIYYTEDGHFRIFYTLSGEDAVPSTDDVPENGIPDYIDKVANGAMFAWQKVIDEYAWRSPGMVNIYIQKMSGGGSSDNSIFMSNNLFTAADIGSLISHEFMHIVENSYDEESPWWEEAVAEWMSHLLYGLFDEYIYFFSLQLTLMDRLGKNYLSLYDYNMAYANSLWVWFLQEWAGKGDQAIIRKMWERAGEVPGENTLESIDYVLKNNGSNLLSAFQEFTVWNYIVGPYDDGKHYPNGDLISSPYGSIKIDAEHNVYPVEEVAPIPPYPLGVNYILLIPDDSYAGCEVEFNGTPDTQWGVSIIKHSAVKNEYNVEHLRADDKGQKYFIIPDWDRFDRVIIVVQNLNTSGDSSSDYNYKINAGEFRSVENGCGCHLTEKNNSKNIPVDFLIIFIIFLLYIYRLHFSKN